MTIKRQWHAEVPVELHGNGKFVVPRRDFTPAYLRTFERGELDRKVSAAIEMLRNCTVCPRDCRVDRLRGETGTCQTGRYARISSVFPHQGEEDCLRGRRGSGTIFFGGCNLRCVFCQNFEISQCDPGGEAVPEVLAEAMVGLQERGCHNINFVTPEHVIPQLLEALPRAIERGLRVPLVYNTGSYDGLDSIRLMEGVVDIYMPDFKLWSAPACARYLTAKDYADVARAAIKAMHGQVGELQVDEDGVAVRGLLIRHLVMPGLLAETREIMRWLATELSTDMFVNLMDQYHPAGKVRAGTKYSEINRRLDDAEYADAMAEAKQAGLWRLDARWRF